MRKVLLFIALCLTTMAVKAQDIIVTKNSERIEGKITEITERQVSYTLKDKPNGSTYTIGLSRVASIIFENGDVYVPKEVPEVVPPANEQYENNETVTTWEDVPEEEIPITLPSGQTVMFRTGVQIEVNDGKTYYGNYLFSNKNKKDYEDFLKQTCPAAYQEQQEANRLINLSVIPLIPCIGFLSVCLYYEARPLFNGSIGDDNFDEWNDMLKPMLKWGGLGIACMCIGVPLSMRAIKHQENARIIFNRDCAQMQQRQRTAYLSFGISPMGAGLSLTF